MGAINQRPPRRLPASHRKSSGRRKYNLLPPEAHSASRRNRARREISNYPIHPQLIKLAIFATRITPILRREKSNFIAERPRFNRQPRSMRVEHK